MTVVVKEAPVPTNAVPSSGATMTAADLTNGDYTTSTVVQDYFIIAANGEKKVTAEISNSRLKLNGEGNPFYQSLGFTVTAAATVTIKFRTGNNASKRSVWLGTLDADGMVEETYLGVNTTKGETTLTATINEAGTYYIYSHGCEGLTTDGGGTSASAGGINLIEVNVKYN